MIFDPRYWLFMLVPIVLGLWAQWRVKAAFAKYSRVPASSGMSGAEAARCMLENAGVACDVSSGRSDRSPGHVAIERFGGFLSDHYDSREKVLRLSPDVYDGRSLAAVGVACHEAGHALQDAHGYAPLVLRNAIVPTAGIGSNLGLLMIVIGGFFLHSPLLAMIGLALFGSVVVFQFVNLPVEFNASSRAKLALAAAGMIGGRDEEKGVATVLDAAAMTYVAATLQTLMTFLYYAWLIFGRRRS
jgi:Zn-dependent membrane protease YugP